MSRADVLRDDSYENEVQALVSIPDERRLKVLLSAYACHPGLGSEPGVGWNMTQQVSRFHEVWVLTNEKNRKAIEGEIARNPLPNVHWEILNVPSAIAGMERLSRRAHYYLWQIAAYQRAKVLHDAVGFDLAHHVTYVSYWTPSFIARLPIPFIWGPIGGGESAPRSFYPTLSRKSQRYEWLRDLTRGFFHHVDPFVRDTVRRSRVIFATTRETAEKLHALGAKDVRLSPESGLPLGDIEVLNALPAQRSDKPFTLMSLGRLIGWKGFHLGLMAFAKLLKEYPNAQYWVVGDGTEYEALVRLAHELDIQDKVVFTGKIPREEAIRRLGEIDVLVHPSLHDSGGWVCLEAMAAGRPVICLDIGGPATQVTPDTGFVVDAQTPEQATTDMAAVMLRLAQNPELGKRMGEAGRRRVRERYTWLARGEMMSQIYREVMSKDGVK